MSRAAASRRAANHAQVVFFYRAHGKLQQAGIHDEGERHVQAGWQASGRAVAGRGGALTISLASTRVPTTRIRTSLPGSTFWSPSAVT